MNRNIILILTIFMLTNQMACKKKTCPAYNENLKEEYKINKNTKHKKARMF
jgi:hypothetical protein